MPTEASAVGREPSDAELPPWLNGSDQLTIENVTFQDGSAYIGQMRCNVREGCGTWRSGGDQYSGQWLQDQYHGEGTRNWSDGRKYEGQFRDGRLQGSGLFRWPPAQGSLVYEGEYTADEKHGLGSLSRPDGSSYSGEWQHGSRHGRGELRTARGECQLGLWAEDRLLALEAPEAEEEDVNIMLGP